MRKKLFSRKGMTLIEMLASILIIALLVTGMSTGMSVGLRVYNTSAFETSSASLASNINTTLSDILRYSSNYKEYRWPGAPDFSISNEEYGMVNCYFKVVDGVLQVHYMPDMSGQTRSPKAVVNSGSYDNLEVKNFTITPRSDRKGDYFEISYRIVSTVDSTATKDVKAIVRMINQ